MSIVEGYHEYTGGCSVHWGDIMSTPRYHDKCGEGHWENN